MTVPATVTIPDGQSSATFDIDAVDDNDVDGTQTVTISVSASSYTGSSDSLDVTDDDVGGGTGTGQIGGTIWNDANGDGIFDGSESPLESWFVFLDQNQNGTLDPNEAAVQTGVDGSYLFEDLPDGTYYVAEILPTGLDPNVAKWWKLKINRALLGRWNWSADLLVDELSPSTAESLGQNEFSTLGMRPGVDMGHHRRLHNQFRPICKLNECR